MIGANTAVIPYSAKGHAPFLRRKRVGKKSLGHRLESPATGSLDGAEHDQHPQTWGGAA